MSDTDGSSNEVHLIIDSDTTPQDDYNNRYRSHQRQIESSNNLSLDWKKRAIIEFYLQLKSVYVYRRLHNCLTIPIILMSTVAGAAIFSSNNQILQYIAASLSIGSALLTGLLRQLQPGEKTSEHLTAVQKWSRIVNKFQLQEIKPSYEKDKFLSMIETEIDSIFSSQPVRAWRGRLARRASVPSPAAVNSMRKKYGTDTMDKIWFGDDIQEDLACAKQKQKEKRLNFQLKQTLQRLISIPRAEGERG
jgi:hypothetical protein